ncbi:MAG: hypothetical protein AAGB48_00475 [Planctomycetota bacterium]
MASHDLESWADRLYQTALVTLPDPTPEHIWQLARGQGRAGTAALLASALTGARPSAVPAPKSLDELLLSASAGLAIEPDGPRGGPGPMTPRSPEDVIEVWTESELTSVHAGWSLESWKPRVIDAARWLLGEIQPDNATNLPWAVHVFASLGVTDGLVEATMYAETLLHNCVVQGAGRPDGLSALILLDAARQLRLERTAK